MNLKQERKIIKHTHWFSLSLIVCIFAVLISACGEKETGPIATPVLPTSVPTATPLPPIPTSSPPGSDANPLVFTFVTAGAEDLEADAQALSEELSSDADLSISVQLVDSNPAAYEALCGGSAVVASLDAFSTIAAQNGGCGEARYIVEIDGRTETQTQIISEKDKVFTLPNVWQRSICRTDAHSASGWIVPMLALKANSVDPFSGLGMVVDVDDDDAVLEAILDGECEVGITEIGAEQALGEDGGVIVLAELPPVPNMSIVVSTQLDGPRNALMSDLLRKNIDAIAALLDADDLVEAEQVNYSALNELLDLAGLDVTALAE